MSAQHAQGRMAHTSAHVIKLPDGYGALADNSAIASRLAACWNCCQGSDTAELESAPRYKAVMDGYREMKAQRDALLEALKDLIAGYENIEHTGLMDMQVAGSDIIKASVAIAKAT